MSSKASCLLVGSLSLLLAAHHDGGRAQQERWQCRFLRHADSVSRFPRLWTSLVRLFPVAETVLALLRQPEYCIYGAANTKGVRGLDAAEERFNEVRLCCSRLCRSHICCLPCLFLETCRLPSARRAI